MSEEQLLVRALNGEITERIPFWFMRQAGRYLPEYREVRASTSGFMDLCFSPAKAAEVTMQPIRRFDMDAAILFSDILVIPHAVGADVRFAPGEGPIVEQTITSERINRLSVDDAPHRLAPIMETVRRVRTELSPEKSLIGFAGSPWTVACYMLQGPRPDKKFTTAVTFAQREPERMQTLIDKLCHATIAYLRAQVEAGANALQLFDSWAGLLTKEDFDRWVVSPTEYISKALKKSHPNTPLIGFAKGAANNLARYAAIKDLNCIGIGQEMDMGWAISQRANPAQAVQGNLDPLLMAGETAPVIEATELLLKKLDNVPCVVNLGHGFTPEARIENVEILSQHLKNYRRSA